MRKGSSPLSSRRLSLALLASLALHALPAVPRLLGGLIELEPELEAELEDDPAAMAAPPPEVKRIRPEDVVPASLFNLHVYQEPRPPKRPPRKKPVPVPTPEDVPTPAVAQVEPPPQPEPPVEEPPVEEPVVADAEPPPTEVVDEEASEPVDDPSSENAGGSYQAWKRKRGADGTGRRGKPNDTPCPGPHPAVTTLSPSRWRVERPLIDFYASNLRELQKLGTVYTHKGKDKKPMGFRVHLARCSVLRQAGLKSGDVVTDVSGRKVYNLLQAVSAYFVLRDDEVITLHVTRAGQAMTLDYEIDPVDKKKSRKERKDAARAAGDLLRMASDSRKKDKDAKD